jgi:hypothetical protein
MLGKTSVPRRRHGHSPRLLVRQRLLCQTPPPPPATVVPDPAKIQEGPADATAMENYDIFVMAHSDCNVCHQNFQPLGLAFSPTTPWASSARRTPAASRSSRMAS